LILEDRWLLRKLRRGDATALQRVYERYKHDLLGLAVTLSRDKGAGEDIVQDVFVSFVRFAPRLRLRTSLRSYLLTAVANRARNLNRVSTPTRPLSGATESPADQAAWENERAMLIEQALAQLPGDQRETILLHLQAGMKFREIADAQAVSVNTIQSRYRYGLEKLRSLLDGKVMP